MNVIREVISLTRREIEEGIPDSASWHQDYRHTAYIFIGNLPFELSEGDVIAIFSQYGEPVHLHLARDKDTGKSRGFGWLKYEDQRSTNLAVDNLTGATVMGRKIRVDHADYKHKDGDGAEEAFKGLNITKDEKGRAGGSDDEDDRRSKRRRRDESVEDDSRGVDPAELAERRREDRELADLERNHDDDDPMKDYLIREKKKEIEAARMEREKRGGRKDKKSSSEHRSRRHRDDRDRSDDERDRRRHRSHRSHRDRDHRDDDEDRDRRSHRNRDGGDREGRDKAPKSSRRDPDGQDGADDDDRRRRRKDDDDKDRRHHRRDDDRNKERRHRDDDTRDSRRRRESRERS
ncbi:hypothetical protein H072_8507 [Dactylellina haptotyla CBS 200.50]|uniref:RRM domain-containing protein n=1 Tax=Dactylellina haptotyla (strain CBS 200.50) TaxID=1284197 RepID=S8A4Z1_DACHA|nr:hypothetical protein H072_8507 [Dactylellina haptotyla CBS 200.50]